MEKSRTARFKGKTYPIYTLDCGNGNVIEVGTNELDKALCHCWDNDKSEFIKKIADAIDDKIYCFMDAKFLAEHTNEEVYEYFTANYN